MTVKREPYRTDAVGFDDIPGQLPVGTIPTDIDLEAQASLAIAHLNDMKPDHFTSNAVWRDLLALTSTFRSFHGRDRVCRNLRTLCAEHKATKFERTISEVRSSSFNWIDVDFIFSSCHEGVVASSAGILSFLLCQDGVWRIWMLRTWLENFVGYGHPDHVPLSRLVAAPTEGDQQRPLGAIIIGAGQAGLSTAGRLQALGITYIAFEKTPCIGDVWRNRYESLHVHTPKEYGPLALGSRFPSEYPNMMPARLMGNGHQAWAEKTQINVRVNADVKKARYDDRLGVWKVIVSCPDGLQTFFAKNLVVTIGPGFAQPIYPEWAAKKKIDASLYKGEVLHGSEWKSAKNWSGKRGIVVGTANTAHDFAEDMANAGMNPVMIQRGATFVLPVEWLHAAFESDYNLNKATEVADRETATYPNKIARDIANTIIHGLVDANAERFDALERSGFKVDRYGDLYACLFERFGGHYVDHGGSARIVKGDIRVESQAIKGLFAEGLELVDGTKIPADLIVVATGFSHDFRSDVAKIIGQKSADRMDEYGGLDAEGEMRGFARLSGHPNLFYHGFDVRACRWYSRFIGLAIQADILGKPLHPYRL